MISSRTVGLVIALIVVLLSPGRAVAQNGDPGPDSPRPTLAERFESIQNLQVREALQELSENWTNLVLAVGVLVLVFLIAAGVLRPGGFAKVGIRDVKPYPALMWLFAALVVYLTVPLAQDTIARLPVVEQLAGGAPPPASDTGNADARTGESDRTAHEFRVNAVVTAGAGLIAMIVGLGMMYLLAKGAPNAGLRLGGMDLMIGLGCFLLMIPLVQLAGIGAGAVYEKFMGEPPEMIAHNTLQDILHHRSDPYVWLMIAAVVIFAPVIEELVFRVGLQSFFLRMFGNPWPGIFITSGLFAAAHIPVLPSGSWHALATLLVLGLGLGVAYERTKRLGVPIAMHMLFNALNIALAFGVVSGEPTGA